MNDKAEFYLYIMASGLSAADAANAAQQRADELDAAIRELELSIDTLWHGETLTTLREHADHWRALADGARAATAKKGGGRDARPGWL